MAITTDNELCALINQEVSSAMGGLSGELAGERAESLRFYLGEKFGNEQDGRSQVVLRDVAEVVDNMIPSLLRIFTTADNVVSFEPVSAEDVEAAQQETDVVRHVWWKQNNGFLLTYTWIKDALVQKNGIVQATWDESEKVTRESYKGLNEFELAELMADDELEPIDQEERTEEVSVGMQLNPETGEPEEVTQEVTVFDVTFKRTTKKGRVVVENIPPEEFLISADATSVDPSSARFVGRKTEKSRQELIEMGFDRDTVMNLPTTDASIEDTEEEIARNHLSDDTMASVQPDPLQQMVEVIIAYTRVDFDDDGIAELREVIKAGNTILSNEEVDRQPFHGWTPCILPHKFFGLSLGDQTRDIQLVRSTLIRQMLDNLYLANASRKHVNQNMLGTNTLQSLMTSRVGNVTFWDGDPNTAFREESTPFVAGQSFPMLEFFDQTKERRTGIGGDTPGLTAESLKNIQQSVVAQMFDMSHMQIEAVARILAETGMKSLFRHIHELLRKNSFKEETFNIRNNFVQIDPSEWRERDDLTIQVGLGAGTREQKLLHLQAIKDLQAQIASSPFAPFLLDEQKIFNTASEFARNALLPNPESFFNDPSKIPPEVRQQIQQQMQGDQQQQQFLQLQAQLEQQQLQIDAAKQEIAREKTLLEEDRKRLELQLRAREQSRKETETENRLLLEFQQFAESQRQFNEEQATKLTELEVKFNENIPGSKV